MHEKNWYPCDPCQYKATEKGNLKKHIQSVHEKVKYFCDLCNKHVKSFHKRVKYSCDQCGKQFTQQGNLKTQIQSVHEKSSILVICVTNNLQNKEM